MSCNLQHHLPNVHVMLRKSFMYTEIYRYNDSYSKYSFIIHSSSIFLNTSIYGFAYSDHGHALLTLFVSLRYTYLGYPMLILPWISEVFYTMVSSEAYQTSIYNIKCDISSILDVHMGNRIHVHVMNGMHVRVRNGMHL